MRRSFLSRLTLLQQWALATLLAILPLMLAVGYAAYSLQQQTARQGATIQHLDQLNAVTTQLIDDVREKVRLARQYRLLRDDTFLELFRQKSATVSSTLTAVDSPQLKPQWRQLLVVLRADAHRLEERLVNGADLPDEEINPLTQSLLYISEELDQAVRASRREIIQQGEQDFARIVDRLFLITMLTLPGTFLLMILGTFFVSRPIWRLSQAIRRLGRQHWERPISVDGPADLVALGDNLEWMRQQVCASDEQKTAFIQHVTHELKTPLAAIIEAASLMRDGVTGQLQPGQREVVDILFSNARYLQDLIQQLLNYNAVSHGLMVHYQQVHLRELVNALRQHLVAAHPDKELRWNIGGTPEAVISDPRLLEMILANLLSNAFRFTPEGGLISVEWKATPQGWQVQVSDSGPGIEDEEQILIFTPFYRGRNSRHDSRPGNGIGLAIVKASVELLKGNLSIQSTPGEGAAFSLSFPNSRKTRPL